MSATAFDVESILQGVPAFTSFCSVEKLHALVETLESESSGFQVKEAGVSVRGRPIHHVRFGTGSVKALVVGGPHCMEPIGSMTVFALLTLLGQRHPSLCAADVEWHIVPCIDPDGAVLNEGWTQQPFTFERYMRHYHLQAPADQVDTSFPIAHKKLILDRPSPEAKILKSVIDEVLPDFYFPLHNAWTGGAFYFLNRPVERRYYEEIYDLLRAQRYPLHRRPIWREICAPFADGFAEFFTIRKYYDYLEKTSPSPEAQLQFGAGSWDHLMQVKPEALIFVAEMGYVRHPDDESERDTGASLRQFKLRLDADSKYLASLLIEEWNNVQGDVDRSCPFYDVVAGGMAFPGKERLNDGGSPIARYPTHELLFNADYDRTMTESDRFNACMVDGGFLFLPVSYQLVRLLRASTPTPAIERAIARLEPAYDAALREIARHVDFGRFEIPEHTQLARVQLGSGLIVLESLLERGGR